MSFTNRAALAYLKERGIRLEAQKAGWKFLHANETQRAVGQNSPSLAIPYFDPSGKQTDYVRYRLLDAAATTDGRRFTQKGKTLPHLYLSPNAGKWTRIAKDTDKGLVLTESEGKAEAGIKAGLFCVGMGGVNGGMKDGQLLADWNAFNLEGRRVDLCPDSDWDSNFRVRKAMVQLGDALTQRGAIVRLHLLFDVTGDGKTGLDDFLRRRGIEAFNDVPTYPLDHPKIAKWRAEFASTAELEPKAVPADWLHKAAPLLQFVWQPILPRRAVGLVIGEGAVGKTYNFLALAISVALGRPYLGYATTSGRVLYAALEDPEPELQRRLHRIGRAMGLSGHDRARLHANLDYMDLVGQQLHLVTMRGGTVVQTTDVQRLIDVVTRNKYSLVILDPMARLHGVDENSNAASTALMTAAEAVAQATGCSVLVGHHTGKSNSTNSSAYAARGGSGLADAARVVLRLMVPPDRDVDRLNLPKDINPADLVQLVHSKGSYTSKVPTIWLQRDADGVLHRYVPEYKAGATSYENWSARLAAWAKDGRTFTNSEASKSRRDILGEKCARKTAAEHITRGMECGDLVATGKNRQGGALYRCKAVPQ